VSAQWKIIAAFATLCVVWSSTWVAIKIGLRDLPPISFAALRFAIAVVVLVAVSVGRVPLLPKTRDDWKLLAFTGVLMFAVNYGLLFWGELHVSSGLAAVLQSMIVVFGMVFAHWLVPAEPLRWQRVAGAVLAVGGIMLICGRLFHHGGWLAFLGGLGIVLGRPAQRSQM
jgi:drug/metabolite transporter (DMT)-like permease